MFYFMYHEIEKNNVKINCDQSDMISKDELEEFILILEI